MLRERTQLFMLLSFNFVFLCRIVTRFIPLRMSAWIVTLLQCDCTPPNRKQARTGESEGVGALRMPLRMTPDIGLSVNDRDMCTHKPYLHSIFICFRRKRGKVDTDLCCIRTFPHRILLILYRQRFMYVQGKGSGQQSSNW